MCSNWSLDIDIKLNFQKVVFLVKKRLEKYCLIVYVCNKVNLFLLRVQIQG